MDFYGRQEAARRQTGRLIALYMLAVLAVIVLVYLVVSLFVVFYEIKESDTAAPPDMSLWRLDLLFWVGGGVLAVVLLASLFKIMELGGGGEVVARSLGGRLLQPGSRDPTERKVLNVVEEMSIASGVPVPSVYLLDKEDRINAFAAGYSPEQAVIGVTRGCAEMLNRDELQGVIAHEFSHVLNGDMRMNIRLIGVLHGILVIGLIGGMLLRTAAYSGHGSSRRSGGGAAIAMMGMAIWIIGYVGLFFGRLIKAAVSRQREFLADASAVQYTRNPDGIGSALQKIGAAGVGSRLWHARAEQFSHMYFGAGLSESLFSMFATHPPLGVRIKRILPSWDGKFPEIMRPSLAEEPREPEAAPPRKAAIPGMEILGAAVAVSAVAQVGQPTSDHLQYAVDLMERLPESLKEAVRDKEGARALVYAMLIHRDEEKAAPQWEALSEHADPDLHARARDLKDTVHGGGAETYLPLIDLAIPALRTLKESEYIAFKEDTERLILSDLRIDPFEWLVRKILLTYLEPRFVQRRRPVTQYYNLAGVRKEASILLSGLAQVGHTEPDEIRRAFGAGAKRIGLGGLELRIDAQVSLDDLDKALEKLRTVAPLHKRTLLQACAACISADKQVTTEEGELLRGIADVLDCPMPPLLPGQKLG
jgi:Zn-dependent protease with chaperone function